MRVFFLNAVLCCAVLSACSVNAQDSRPGSSGESGPGSGDVGSGPVPSGPGTGAAGPGTGAAGGAATADFSTLMNLIQNTVEPNGWLANGGTSSMMAYPAGVHVDPLGHMRRTKLDVQQQMPDISAADQRLHPWTRPSPRRVISLRSLDTALRDAALSGQPAKMELARLAGLARIDYVRVDTANEDILIAGPTGEATLGFHLEDLAVVTALIHSRTQPWGCSIDPENAGIQAAQALLEQPGAIARLARSPVAVAEEMQRAIGPHRVSIFGINPHSSTAIALLDADEHMKKVGFGTARVQGRVATYFDHLDKQKTVPAQSMVRWWFAYGDGAVKVSRAGDVFALPKNCVRVMSQQQWMTATGRQASGGQDAAADAFAADFSKQIQQLRKTYPSYARLNAVFESALALQLALDATGQPNFRAWLPNLCALGAMETPDLVQPKTVEGMTTTHRLNSGTVIAVVSGGVKLDVNEVAVKANFEPSSHLVAEQVPSARDSAGGFWWSVR